MSFTRRSFVKAATASGLSLPFVPLQGFAADTDVVIVGAGAAGLAAARQLMEKGKKFKLIEAGNRIGGRAFTDTNTFGVPFDLGCTYQHYASTNPWVKFAKKNKFPIGKLPGEDTEYVNIGRRAASGKDWDAMVAKYEKIYRALKRAGTRGRDISMRDAIRKIPSDKWSPIAENWYGMNAGTELEKASVLEWWNSPDGEDFHCPAGYGTLVEFYGKGIPVELNTVAKEIEISGNGVSVVTNQGTISAKHCLITVSLGVLESELIKFKPGLSKRKLRAINSLTMANYLIFGLKFERPKIFPSRTMAWFWIVNNQEKLLEYMGNVGEHGIQRAAASGDLAIELENLGQEEALEVVKARLGASLPKRKMKLYQAGVMSKWNNDPFFKGTWALAKPGQYGKRAELSKPEHKRLHFAGEATHKTKWGLCDGALLTGIDAGKKLTRLV